MIPPSIIWKPARSFNFASGRKSAISRITFHHIVGDAPGALNRFQNTNDQVSSHYVIGSDGTIYQCVSENDTAFADGSTDSNNRSISIEHAGGLPEVPYTNAMYDASTRLVAWLIHKYGIVDFKRHRDVIDKKVYPGGTACPGQLDVERIVNGANALLKEDDMVKTDKGVVIALWTLGFGRPPTDQELKNNVGRDVLLVLDEVASFAPKSSEGIVQTRQRLVESEAKVEQLSEQVDPDVLALAQAIKKVAKG